MKESNRFVFLDYLRVIACFMVMLVHCCEQFYFNDDGSFAMSTRASGAWATFVDSACRASVPLFVMASGYLLFPVSRSTGAFFRRRLLRVFVPFVVFCCAYGHLLRHGEIVERSLGTDIEKERLGWRRLMIMRRWWRH